MSHIQPDTTLPKTPVLKQYMAKLTQTSTNAPTAVISGINTIGPIVWTRTAPGTYRGTLAGTFKKPNIWIQNNAGATISIVPNNLENEDYVEIYTEILETDGVEITSQLTDGLLLNTPIFITILTT